MADETTETTETTESTQNTDAATFASHLGEGGTLNEGWKETIPEEYRGEKCLDLFTDVNGMIKTLVSSQKAFGKDKIVVPSETSTPEELSAWQKAWGKPDTAADYKFGKDENIPEDMWNANRIEEFKVGAFDLAFNGPQMEFIEKFYNDSVKDDLAAYDLADKQAIEAGELELKKRLGGAYEERKHLAERVVALAPEGPVREAVNEAFGTNPLVVEWFSELGKKLVESKAVDTTINQSTPKELIQEITNLQSTPGYMDGTLKKTNMIAFKQLQEKIEGLYKKAYPDS